MEYTLTKNADGKVISFSKDGSTYTLKRITEEELILSKIASQGIVELVGDKWYSFSSGGGSSTTTDKALLEYVVENNNLKTGTELTESDPSIPDVNNNKGFLTSATESPLLDFYKAFAYNETNYNLMVNSRNIEVSFLCSDRRYGVAGSRRAWSPYFKIRDLEKSTFTVIQNNLVGTDTTAAYNIQAKITRNANDNLFITLTDTHSGVNLYGSVINIRHRVV